MNQYCTHAKTVEQICYERNARLTPIRKALITLILENKQPLSAYDLLKRLRDTSHPSAEAMTVYRGLAFLQEHGLVHRLPSSQAYIACCDPTEPHYGQFLLCQRCGWIKEIEASNVIDALQTTANLHQFSIAPQTIEILGLCAGCSS
ncbi:MAG: transcriptional repressor [Coxiellaceae bacterium]|nr:MAG: transcriptional repressor [Coxiellaceae bacterium]